MHFNSFLKASYVTHLRTQTPTDPHNSARHLRKPHPLARPITEAAARSSRKEQTDTEGDPRQLHISLWMDRGSPREHSRGVLTFNTRRRRSSRPERTSLQASRGDVEDFGRPMMSSQRRYGGLRYRGELETERRAMSCSSGADLSLVLESSSLQSTSWAVWDADELQSVDEQSKRVIWSDEVFPAGTAPSTNERPTTCIT